VYGVIHPENDWPEVATAINLKAFDGATSQNWCALSPDDRTNRWNTEGLMLHAGSTEALNVAQTLLGYAQEAKNATFVAEWEQSIAWMNDFHIAIMAGKSTVH
jgi:hypothetical protein